MLGFNSPQPTQVVEPAQDDLGLKDAERPVPAGPMLVEYVNPLRDFDSFIVNVPIGSTPVQLVGFDPTRERMLVVADQQGVLVGKKDNLASASQGNLIGGFPIAVGGVGNEFKATAPYWVVFVGVTGTTATQAQVAVMVETLVK